MKDETTVYPGEFFGHIFTLVFKKKKIFLLIDRSIFPTKNVAYWADLVDSDELIKKKLPPKLENKSLPTNPNEKSVGRIQKWGWSRIYDVPQCFNTWYCMVPVITGTYWTSHFYNTVWIFETVPVRMLNSKMWKPLSVFSISRS